MPQRLGLKMKVKDAIRTLVPYKPNVQDVAVKLDANEGENYLFPTGININQNVARYPQSNADSLRLLLATKYNLDKDNFIIGNGSTELLEIAVKTYCNPNDVVLSIEPSFSMYKIYATLNGARFIAVPGDKTEYQETTLLLEYIKEYNPKIIFLCTPNNPTGSIIKKEEIIKVLKSTDALVIVDEAYMEFCEKDLTVLQLVNEYDNLVVAKTFSKAYGLAFIRLGYMISNQTVINQLLSVKLPYSVNGVSVDIASLALQRDSEMKIYTKGIITRRNVLYKELTNLGIKAYPSQANFIFVNTKIKLAERLLEKGILIRSFGQDNYRITIGTTKENETLLRAIKEMEL